MVTGRQSKSPAGKNAVRHQLPVVVSTAAHNRMFMGVSPTRKRGTDSGFPSLARRANSPGDLHELAHHLSRFDDGGLPARGLGPAKDRRPGGHFSLRSREASQLVAFAVRASAL